ncbi:MAG: hypothetical protein ACRC7J_17235 [Vibrio ordalii]|uniref:hypothetical protein n=1 Tax=Vibrio ordalii TaxID=28174 RepID=UPI003F3FC43B
MPKIYFVLFLMIGFTVFNYLSVDRSAVRTAGGLLWKGERYVEVDYHFNEVDLVGKTTGGESIMANLKDDPEINCLVIRSFLDQYFYVKEKHIIKKRHINPQRYNYDKC